MDPAGGEEGFAVAFTTVTLGYSETLRTPLLAGRGFTAGERRDAPADRRAATVDPVTALEGG
jgi:hypothetical protein